MFITFFGYEYSAPAIVVMKVKSVEVSGHTHEPVLKMVQYGQVNGNLAKT